MVLAMRVQCAILAVGVGIIIVVWVVIVIVNVVVGGRWGLRELGLRKRAGVLARTIVAAARFRGWRRC